MSTRYPQHNLIIYEYYQNTIKVTRSLLLLEITRPGGTTPMSAAIAGAAEDLGGIENE